MAASSHSRHCAKEQKASDQARAEAIAQAFLSTGMDHLAGSTAPLLPTNTEQQQQEDSFVSSLQCSADPNAFVGFHVASTADEAVADLTGGFQHDEDTQAEVRGSGTGRMRLVLDLDATTSDVTRGGFGGFRPVSVSVSQLSPSDSQSHGGNSYSELFAVDTQDDATTMMPIASSSQEALRVSSRATEWKDRPIHHRRKPIASPFKRRRAEDDDANSRTGGRTPSPPPTLLVSMEKARLAKRKQVSGVSYGVHSSTGSKDVSKARDGGRDTPQTKEAGRKGGVVVRLVPGAALVARQDSSQTCDSSEPPLQDIIARTYSNGNSLLGASAFSEYSEDLAPQLLQVASTDGPTTSEEHKGEEDARNVGGETPLGSNREVDDEDAIECTQTLEDECDPRGDGRKMDGVTVTTPYYHSDSVTNDEAETEVFVFSDTGTVPYGENSTFDDGDKAANSSISRGDVTTPVVQRHVENASSNEQDDDEGEVVSTQPSEFRDEAAASQPLGKAPSPPGQNAVRRADKASTQRQQVATDSQAKAIRNLEFSFALPESQGTESQRGESLSDARLLASKTLSSLSKSAIMDPFESSISPVWPPTAENDHSADSNLPVTKVLSTKRKEFSSPLPELPTGKKQKSLARSEQSPHSVKATPRAIRKHKEFFSPDSSFSSKDSEEFDLLTPRPPVRRSTRSSQSTPSSTPTVRTRAKLLSPLPSNRAYASRSRTIFTFKFQFCLTGFVKSGETSLVELIEEHGGKVADRFQDVLYKNNPKAVVIATPVSWRKRKFMQAIACGIPVVHPEWLHACIKAGSAIPFEGYHVPSGYSNLTIKSDSEVDIVLCEEYTKVRHWLPYSAGLSKTHSRVLDIPASQVKRRVVAVSKEDFDTLAYRDESIFYFDEFVDEKKFKSGKKEKWLTQ
ncbi:hypothetical protein BBJ28_00002775 [Nothophytophthora sp. Chile5]|nr:hypothetical protein BBJ28_00002775 [Nothophytophthora sp. Chile5]